MSVYSEEVKPVTYAGSSGLACSGKAFWHRILDCKQADV